MKILAILFFLLAAPAQAFTVFDLNVFDQLQGSWEPNFREKRITAISEWLKQNRPDVVMLQEAQGGGNDSKDAIKIRSIYPYRFYVHEMTGADGESYGYWLGARKKPRNIWHDGFSFPGGVVRKTLAAVWDRGKHECVGVLSLHLSYQTSEVRVKEAKWIEDWIKGKQNDCKHWLVIGDFNADENSPEIKKLFSAGFRNLFTEVKPTVGAINPIRQIYGKDVPSQTIDWALGKNFNGSARVVLDRPVKNVWVSDHAGILIDID